VEIRCISPSSDTAGRNERRFRLFQPQPTNNRGDASRRAEALASQQTAGNDERENTGMPDGIAPRHFVRSSGLLRGFLPIFLLGALLLAALFGVFGGASDPQVSAEGNGARLTVTAPRTLRSGMILELDIDVSAGRAIAQPVVAISGSYLHELSFNSIIPQASQAAFENGTLTLHYDALQPGDRLHVKMDGQVNPPLIGENDGVISIRDGETVLARRPVSLWVFP
jgi:hypothetical protein